MEIKKSTTLCRLPWHGLSNEPTGTTKPCCIFKGAITNNNGHPYYVQDSTVAEIFNSDYMKTLRQQFRNNEKPVQCNVCWTDEESGYKSKRQIYNDMVEMFSDDGSTPFEDTNPEFPAEFQMILSNTCNLKCRSCATSHSSLWEAEQSKFPSVNIYKTEFTKGQSGRTDGLLWTDRLNWYKPLRRLEIVGGEPFYSKQWRQVWEELIELGYSKNINLDMSTNCILIYPELVRMLAKSFKRVGVGISIDGMNEQFEYLRHPGKWSQTDKNIRQYAELSKSVDRFNCQATITVSWLNAWYLPELVQYFRSVGLKVWLNIVHFPEHMAVKNTPLTLRHEIMHKWSMVEWGEYETDVIGLINTMKSHTPTTEETKTHLAALSIIDTIRNETFSASFHEIAPFLNL